jgi:ubiquilin
MSENLEFEIRVKLIDDRVFNIPVKSTSTIFEIKEQIAVVSDIPTNRQRLIFQGKLLKDHETANELNLQTQHTIHLVQNIPAGREGTDPQDAIE